ncbi:MAG: SDR family NAD(P)-dependent oxidoreductase, partial [Actinomycetota bacterium]|nr:SDR family NAD(P)-dependent oxidoreductase [Actinomycetota bacterium]
AVLCVAARREARLKSLVDDFPGSGHSYVVTDVSDREQVERLARHVEHSYGRCDVLINNAGFGGERSPFGGVEAIPDLERVMATNFFGAVYCTAEFLPLLLRATPSNIVNVASVAGKIALGGASAYSASKFALVGWSESLHYELADRGICVSLVEPGFIPTEGFPQNDLLSDPILRHVVGSEDQVSATIREAIAGRRFERTVPRWYYLAQIPRLIAPPFYRYVLGKATTRYGARLGG